MCKCYFKNDINNYINKIKHYINNIIKNDYDVYNELNVDLKKNLSKSDIECDYILINDN